MYASLAIFLAYVFVLPTMFWFVFICFVVVFLSIPYSVYTLFKEKSQYIIFSSNLMLSADLLDDYECQAGRQYNMVSNNQKYS